MSQATLSATVYRNSDFFSGCFLDERVGDLDGWDCDVEAEAAFEDLRALWDAEGELVASYNEDELLDAWLDLGSDPADPQTTRWSTETPPM